MSTKTLSLKTKLGYGVCDLGGNLFFTLIGFFLMFFLTEILGLNPALAGWAVAIGRIWDAVTDPLIGYFSDRTQSKWGRRRPYMFVGAILLFIGAILMFFEVKFNNQMTLFAWVTFTYCFFNTAYTLVNIPYGALAPEITNDYKEQSDLNGFRMSFAIVGTLLCVIIARPIADNISWVSMGAVMGTIMMISALITVFLIKESPRKIDPSQTPKFTDYFEVARQKHFITILIPWAVNIAGINVIMQVLFQYFKHIYNDEASANTGIALLLVFALLAIFFWVQLSKKIGKKWTYIIGMGFFSIMIMIFFFVGGSSDVIVAFVIMALAGIGLSTHYVMPFALIPDVVEWDYSQKGKRREGIYYGLWTFCSKIGQSLAAVTYGQILNTFGYVQQGATQTEAAKFGLSLLVGPIAVAFFLVGILFLVFYPISPKVYQGILEKIKARDAKKDQKNDSKGE